MNDTTTDFNQISIAAEVTIVRAKKILVQWALCRFVWNATALSDGRGGAERMIRQVLQA